MSGTHEHLSRYLYGPFVLVAPDATLDQAMHSIRQRQLAHPLDAIILLRDVEGRLCGAPLFELRKWKNAQADPSAALHLPLGQAGSPLALLAEMDEDESGLGQARQAAGGNPYRLAAVTCVGEVCGVICFSADGAVLCAGQSSGSLASAPTVTEDPAQPFPGAAGESPVLGTSAPFPPHTPQTQPWLQRGRVRLRAFYRRFRVQTLLAVSFFLVTLLVQYLLPLYTLNLSDLFPSFFPPTMTGEWNVLVTGFYPAGDDSLSWEDARHLSEVFFYRFASEIDSLALETGVSVQVLGPGKTARIEGATPELRASSAAELARRVKADIVVYGVIERTGQDYLLKPEFYVNTGNFYEAEEVSGEHHLGSDITILTGGGDLMTQANLNRELSHRSEVLALIAKGLGFYLVNQYEDALKLFQKANDPALWEFNAGREVVYLFTGNAAGRARLLPEARAAYEKAIEIEPRYARAYVGLAGVYYLHGLEPATSQDFKLDMPAMGQALQFLEVAEHAPLRPPSADLPAKIAFGRAQVYLAEWFAGEDTLEQARQSFQTVITEYGAGRNPRLQEQASEAHARLGMIARQANDRSQAVTEYTIARQLATNPSRRGVYCITLGDLYSEQGKSSEARQAYQDAVQEFKAAIALTSQPNLDAEYWTSIASAYEKLGQVTQLAAALREAINYLPDGSPRRAELQRKLENLRDTP